MDKSTIRTAKVVHLDTVACTVTVDQGATDTGIAPEIQTAQDRHTTHVETGRITRAAPSIWSS